MVTDRIIVTQKHVENPSTKNNCVLFGEHLQHGQRQSLRTASRSASSRFIGNYATVNVLGYCGNIDRSLFHLRKILQSQFLDLF